MTQSEILEQTRNQVKTLKKRVMDEFYYQDEKSLEHKPAPEKWSAIQCFEHVNLSNRHYIDQILKCITVAKEQEGVGSKKFRSGLIGGYMIKSMKPKDGKVTNPMPTFTKVKPLAERQEGVIVKAQPVFTDFFEDLDAFLKICDALSNKDIQKMRVNSLIGSYVKFRVGDALPFLMAHTERHVIQAANALGSGYDVPEE